MRSIVLLFAGLVAFGCASHNTDRKAKQSRELDELSALWSHYKFAYIRDGRVVSLDENGITTSEGQSYAMLRAVWSNDRATFDAVWAWTRSHLQVRKDKLFAWKWKEKVLDANSATDADTDIALALIVASRRWQEQSYQLQALDVLADIWRQEVIQVGRRYFVTAGDWAPAESYPTLHVAYLAPYAYEVLASVDGRHPWKALVASSYEVLRWIYFDQKLPLPPEIIYLDKATGNLHLKHPKTGVVAPFGYDSVPIFWRVAADELWFSRGETRLRREMLRFFETGWARNGKIFDRYRVQGSPISSNEGWPHLAAVHALARLDNRELAEELRAKRLDGLWEKALAGAETPYYLHNWLWFGRALDLGVVRHHDEFLGFLRPFDFEGFSASFPWFSFALALLLFPLARRFHWAKVAFITVALVLCFRYLAWRTATTLNFRETLGPVISVGLLAAEIYSCLTVLLLIVQVGLKSNPRARPSNLGDAGSLPSVDVLIPIYSEPLDILDKTLAAAMAIRYPNKRIFVCDDSHRDEVWALTEEHGGTYIKGPKKHAKAGNLNNALGQTSGELIVVFDTDHIPVATFLEKTVPLFADPKIGFVQTPHHFYNEDIFQRAFRTRDRIPDEQDMFNHGIQGGRDGWGGSFFVGSGAVFRRSAMAEVGGFNLMSITEDIHTSQHLHAAGWKSAFVDEDLAVGLTAENLSSYLVQRRRWMLGCLQIFFKDNPLLMRRLPLRHRLGYFASLYYFLFPIPRVLFWAAPLCFLLFHLHPLFADVSVLLGNLVPYMVLLPMIGMVLLPAWPRMLWGVVYEFAISFPLLRSMFDLLLPKNLGFKVTPKGITSAKRSFDFGSTRLTLIAAALTAFAIVKGIFEFEYFGIEKDAYFINLGWAIYNLVVLLASLLVAWERPQRRTEDRIARAIPIHLEVGGVPEKHTSHEMSLAGFSLLLPVAHPGFPNSCRVMIDGARELSLEAQLVYCERVDRTALRAGFRLLDVTKTQRRELVRRLYGAEKAWTHAHRHHPRSNVVMLWRFTRGLASTFRGDRLRRRRRPRRFTFRWFVLVSGASRHLFCIWNRSANGLGAFALGRTLPGPTGRLPVLGLGDGVSAGRVIHSKRILPFVWRVGFSLEEATSSELVPIIYLAA